MSNDKRERQRAHRQAQADATQQATKNSRRTKILIRWVAIAAAVLLVAFLWSLTGGEDATPETAVESIGAEALGIEGCPAIDGSSAKRTQFETPPKLCIDPGQLYSAKFTQTCIHS